MGSGKAAVAFFQTEYIIVGMVSFKPLNLFADELEASQYFNQLYAVSIGNGFCHVGGNNGGDQRRFFRHGVCLGSLS